MNYVFDTVNLHDDSAAAVARRDAWFGSVAQAFHEPRPAPEQIQHMVTSARTDGAICRGAWLPDGEFGAGPAPVATFISFDKTINVGHELLPVRMISDVTASPAHRRRGLVRTLMEADLTDAATNGVALAALTASEATIYGRWGFGPATFVRKFELETGPRFGLRSFTDPGRMELIEPAVAWPHISSVFEAFHRARRGSIERPSFYEILHTGAFDFSEGGPAKKLRCAVHLDADGTVDGFVLYEFDGSDREKPTIKVNEMLALNATTQLALWDFLAHIDLSNRVIWRFADPADPLPWALTDINALTISADREFVWLRVLDVERVLSARPWAANGRVVLDVEDAQGHAAGTYAIESDDGRAVVTRSTEKPELTVTAETLAVLCLGTAPVTTLAAAGRVSGAPDAVGRLAAMADLPDRPYTTTFF
ncbi:GNAT family N-acetyltransferase [Ruania halotolerans]|uniref:GNAT family N-acetyltransferase n=1 Tax=Ruania halotolerans TaxID=2897773 RepID=UPI001E643B83|nr:GNAT family N-acetyltransferase [Ruania halotolerans]UFU06277.1 GNAT family N-acetyltransferase [Ruania halotolerans]